MTPSPQQAAFYDWIQNSAGSCVLEAVAGAGKTTTLIEALRMMRGDVFFGAYNKAIAVEIKERAPKDAMAKIDISTFHAAGFRFWRRVAKNVQVDGGKCRAIFRAAVERHPEYAPFESSVLQLVSLAKQAGLGVLKPTTEAEWSNLIDHFDVECPAAADGSNGATLTMKLACRLLKESVAKDHEVVDFDDMIYAPLVHNARVWEHDWVLVDEAQDTNATRRALALRMLKRGGRLVAVGDPHQAIYGFTGADSDALDLIAKAVNAVRMPLTVTYRCPKAVVNYAQTWVRHITAADTAPAGSVERIQLDALATAAKPGDAVLCRFTAPLVTHVYAFIAKGIPAKIEGREIGEGLKALATRWKTDSLAKLSTYLASYLEVECAKLRAKEKESKAAALEDKVQCLGVLIERAKQTNPKAEVADLLNEIDNIFGDSNDRKAVVTFSTIHKSKGREWSTVVWLETGASPWARKQWEQDQEANLCYVAATRAKSRLVTIAI